MKALHELTQEEYIKHLEEYLLNSWIDQESYYWRCQHCERVEYKDHMTDLVAQNYVCDTCYDAYCDAKNRAQEIAASDERDYRAAKGNS